ncbi:MAG: hypothetical protein KME10_28295 [Plectolyngbya sp. WJT66-NPBG17]|nr:hypothetical protein [Plectolyngbya sp. WJT66-NPBG17]
MTGIQVGHNPFHRLAQETTLADTEVQEEVKEISLDDGKVRVRTPKGEPSK